MIRTQEEHLAHYGVIRRSGRYPWGSGGDLQAQAPRNTDFLQEYNNLRKKGVTEKEIADSMGFGSTTELRAHKSIVVAEHRQAKISTAERLRDKGMSTTAIGRQMGLNESSVRALLAPGAKDKADAIEVTSKVLKEQVDKNSYIQIGRGVDAQLGITKNRLDTSVARLKEQGYTVHNIQVEQLGIPGQYTKMKVLAKPGVTLQEVQRNRADIKLPFAYSNDNGRSYFHTQEPISISSRRISVAYNSKADGVIYVRPGVKDLDMGGNRYSQVRIMVDHTHYMKGMAVYKDDLPEGVDLVFNTKKSNTGRKKDAMKPIADDPELPFGSIIRQINDPKTGKVSSAMNMVGSKEGAGTEGAWDTWSRNLSTQMLSKQSPDLASTQLNLTYERHVRELTEIRTLTNPSVKKKLLLGFAESADSAAVHLQAAQLPRQATKVLLPLSTIKEGEVYAPNMKHGERVALVRYPHAGKFEIPQVTVNNRNPEGRKLIGNGKDAIGIHPKVAQHLSGADFDGDTVVVIPNNNRKVKSTDPLDGLKDFDPMVYAIPKDSPIKAMTSQQKGQQMGSVSNLITDMTLQHANNDEIARAVRHSMVVIDAQNHKLDWKQSEKDNGILELKRRYQSNSKGLGASTLISRAKAPEWVPQRELRKPSRGGPIDPLTGKKVWEPTGYTRTDFKTGKVIPRTTKVPKLALVDDAHQLSSGTAMENVYADHSNRLKAIANEARKEAINLKGLEKSDSASKVYAEEVASLAHKLNVAKKNAPLESHAQLLAGAKVRLKKQANPNLTREEETKIKQFALTEERARLGAKKERIQITPKEWEAIQAGALSKTRLDDVLNNTDLEIIKKYAMPKTATKLSPTALTRARTMMDNGYSEQDAADALGITLSRLRMGLENG